ncbi:MAG: class I SAM-dependent methyltransferase [Rickettsiaceae bacterium H1]|nr:class I SAM-dependent methyltransferase [Rickettsiaceae bacterium H1]
MRNLVKTNFELGLYHFYKGNKDDAFLRFRLLKLCTSHVSPLIYYNLGRCYFVSKKFKKAKQSLMNALQMKEYYPEVNYYLNKIDKPFSITEVPISIIEEKFDYITPYYVESYIINRQYQGYKIVLHEIIDHLPDVGNIIDILDVGCGTGICGHFLKMNGVGSNIVGLDISSKMLSIAERCYVNEKAVYSKLLHMSCSKYFSNFDVSEKFDIILAIDSLGYEQELYETFRLFQNVLKKGGIIISIVRALEKPKEKVEFLQDADIFCYSQDYMLSIPSKLDMEVLKVIKCQLYDDVMGYLCMFVKK